MPTHRAMLHTKRVAAVLLLLLILVSFLQFSTHYHQSIAVLSLEALSAGGPAPAAADNAVKTRPVPQQQVQPQHPATLIQQHAPGKVALLVLAAVWRWHGSSVYEEPRGWGSRQHLYWLAVANRRLYTERHGYPLYVLSHHLEAGRWPTWDKLMAADAVLQHSRAEWVWMTDADAFVMNPATPVTQVIESAAQHSMRSWGAVPDVIAAQDCILPINSGSVIFRNTPWTRQHLADLWHADDNCNGYTDNGAFLELWKQPEARQHYWQVPQRQLNAYPPPPNNASGQAQAAACPNGTYQEGDLFVHFPGDFKAALPAFLQNSPPPHLPSTPGAPHTAQRKTHLRPGAASSARHDVACYAVYDGHSRGGTDAAGTQAVQQHADLVEVSMVSVRRQGISTTTKVASITLSIQQQQQAGWPLQMEANPGWPVALPTEALGRGSSRATAPITDLAGA